MRRKRKIIFPYAFFAARCENRRLPYVSAMDSDQQPSTGPHWLTYLGAVLMLAAAVAAFMAWRAEIPEVTYSVDLGSLYDDQVKARTESLQAQIRLWNAAYFMGMPGLLVWLAGMIIGALKRR